MANKELNYSRSDIFDIDLDDIKNKNNKEFLDVELEGTRPKPVTTEDTKELSQEEKDEAKSMMKDLAKFVPNVAAETGNFLLDVAQIPSYAYNAYQDVVLDDPEDQIPILNIPTMDYENKGFEYAEMAASLGTGFVGMLKGLKTLAAKSPKVYAKLKEAYPYQVGQFMDTLNNKGLKGIKESIVPSKETLSKLARNLNFLVPSAFVIDKPKEMAMGGGPGEIDYVPDEYGGAFSNPITQEDPYINIEQYLNQPGVEGLDELEIFDLDLPLAENKSGNFLDDIEGTKVALLGKVPAWAVANIDKAKTLTKNLSKGENNILNSIKNKIKPKEEAVAEDGIEEVLDDTIPDTTAVTKKKEKIIVDSPEASEDVFYSGIEARLMDPNTPDSFDSVDAFYNFLNSKGISKAEVGDYALEGFLETSAKSGVKINKNDLLEVIREAPIRKIKTITYGNEVYGGVKRPKYGDQYMEKGYIPGSYRENVLYLEPENIPLDPGKIREGDPAHSFDENYVLGWVRSSDRPGYDPNVTTEGIGKLGKKEVETLNKNIATVTDQTDQLKISAIANLADRSAEVKQFIETELDYPLANLPSKDLTTLYNRLGPEISEMDSALYNQIKAFDEKLLKDTEKLKLHTDAVDGNKFTVTFADEIQSDILQQAKRFEEKMTKQLGDLIDANAITRRNTITGKYDYQNLNPEVVEYFIANKTVFRPMFQSAQEMQTFLDKFAKNKQVFEELSAAGVRPSEELKKKAFRAAEEESKMLSELKTSLSTRAMEYLYPNVPFKNRNEWGSALIKNDLSIAAKRLFQDEVEGAATWYAISPSKFITKRYGQQGGTATPKELRTKDMKGIGMEEFYGGPDSVDPKGKHYTSTLEKILKKAAKDNNSEFKIIKVKVKDGEGKDSYQDAFAIKLTPEMLLPHKTHRKSGGFMYTPENIDIFEAA